MGSSNILGRMQVRLEGRAGEEALVADLVRTAGRFFEGKVFVGVWNAKTAC
jgi:2-methylaconitate cis-trans-isomerase PrpF